MNPHGVKSDWQSGWPSQRVLSGLSVSEKVAKVQVPGSVRQVVLWDWEYF